jgi:putative DNA primase/helicase
MMPFKNKTTEELMTYDQVSGMPEFAGIIANEVVLIDVDDYEESEILMKIVEDLQLACRVYETTRGKHFFFMNKDFMLERCGTHKLLACGITADIKVGHKNSYSVLKFNDKERKIIYDIYDDVVTVLVISVEGHYADK